MRLGLMALVVAMASGCSAGFDDANAGDTDDFIDQDVPPGNCTAGTTGDCPDPGTTGTPPGGACNDSNQCADGGHCIAPYDGEHAGDFTCSLQCLPLDDQGAWCQDSSACCDEGAICRRGLCVIDEGLDGSGTGDGTAGDSGTTGDGTAGSGTMDGTGTAGMTDGGSSDTGGATGTTGMQ